MIRKKFTKLLRILGVKSSLWFLVSIASGLVFAVLEAQLAMFIQVFLKNLNLGIDISNGPFSFLQIQTSMPKLMLILIIVGALRSLAQFLVNQSACTALETINARLRVLSLYDLLIRQSHRAVSASDMQVRIGEIFPHTAQFFYFLAQSVPQLIVAASLTFMLFFISLPSALVALCGLGLVAGVLFRLNASIRKYTRIIPGEQNQLVTGIERVTRNWLLVRVFRTNNKEFYRLSHNALNYAGHSIKAHTFANLAGSIPPLLGIFLLVLLIYINIEILHSSSSIIISFLYLFFRLVQTLSIAAGSLGSMSRFFNHAQITAQYLDTFSDKEISKATDSIHSLNVFGLSPSGMTPSPAMNPSPNQTGAPTIAMQKISFSYAEGKPHILEDFSFDLKAGEHLGLVGKSGSGKSTLLAILLGVLSPKKGRVQIAGLEARDYFQNFADRIGFVGSEPFLIEGSIKDNLDYGSSRTYSGDEYRKALESASLYTFVDQLPERLNYKIEENGSGLSAGQKQRLALARALLREPLFLVLDEMTANLDQETELEITTGLATLKGKTTVMIVSHRKETLRFVDRILEL